MQIFIHRAIALLDVLWSRVFSNHSFPFSKLQFNGVGNDYDDDYYNQNEQTNDNTTFKVTFSLKSIAASITS